MAYQPIYMPDPYRAGEGIASLTEFMMERRREEQARRAQLVQEGFEARRIANAEAAMRTQDERAKAEKERLARLERLDRVNLLGKLQEIEDPQMQKAMLQALGGTVESEDILGEAPQPKMPQVPTAPQPPPQGGSPVPDGVEFARPQQQTRSPAEIQRRAALAKQAEANGLPKLAAQLRGSPGMGAAPPADAMVPITELGPEDMPPMGGQMRGPGMSPPRGGMPPGDELLAPQNRQVLGQRLRARFDDGSEFVIDPVERQRRFDAERERWSGIASEALAPKYAVVASAMMRSNVEPKAAYDAALRMQREDEAALRQRERDQFLEAGRNLRDRTGSGGGSSRDSLSAAQEMTARRGWTGTAETMFENFTRSQDYKQLVESKRNYDGMLTDLTSGEPALIMAGIGKWVKEASGGGVNITEAEFKRYVGDAIPWDEKAKREFDKLMSGGAIDPNYVRPFAAAIQKHIVARSNKLVERVGSGARGFFAQHSQPELRQFAEDAYRRATMPLRSDDELAAMAQPKEEPMNPIEAGRAKANEKNKARARAVKTGGRGDNLDQALKMLGD